MDYLQYACPIDKETFHAPEQALRHPNPHARGEEPAVFLWLRTRAWGDQASRLFSSH